MNLKYKYLLLSRLMDPPKIKVPFNKYLLKNKSQITHFNTSR